jgi:hypothetical protein
MNYRMNDKDLQEIEEIFKRSLDILYKTLVPKIDKIIEVYQMIAEKLDRMEERLRRKFDAVTMNHLHG